MSLGLKSPICAIFKIANAKPNSDVRLQHTYDFETKDMLHFNVYEKLCYVFSIIKVMVHLSFLILCSEMSDCFYTKVMPMVLYTDYY